MVSFQAALSSEERQATPNLHNLLKKRKREDGGHGEELAKEPKLCVDKITKPAGDDIELNIDTPLPLEWQRCLDIKSGQIHFYNTRTHTRTSKDPRESPERPDVPCPLSLDLELNLTCDPKRSHADEQERSKRETSGFWCNSADNPNGLSRTSSWVSFDADQREMVAAVCMRCHMLVMMCKASPSCPNCKFLHPPPEKSSSLLKPEFRLLCCKD